MQQTGNHPDKVKCENCGKLMKWDSYTLARRPDTLRERDGRAPIEWAWHCRCGKWEYGKR